MIPPGQGGFPQMTVLASHTPAKLFRTRPAEPPLLAMLSGKDLVPLHFPLLKLCCRIRFIYIFTVVLGPQGQQLLTSPQLRMSLTSPSVLQLFNWCF